MNNIELAYTVSVLRRLAESAFNYQNEDYSWEDDLAKDIKDANMLIMAYDKRLKQQTLKTLGIQGA